jgi:membrane protein
MRFTQIQQISPRAKGYMKKLDFIQIKDDSLMILRKINRFTGGSLTILRDAFHHYSTDRAIEAAGTISYFTFFSIFPLIIGIISIASKFLEINYIKDNLVTYITSTIPVSSDLIITNINVVLEKRGTVGAIAIVGLIWSATAMFNTLALNLDRAWPDADSHNVFERRLVAIAMFVSLAAMLIVTLFLSATLDVLPHFNIKLWGTLSTYETAIWKLASNIGPFILRFAIIYAIYRFVPKAFVPSNSAFWGALFATSGWEIVTTIMTSYLSSGLVQYELVYGSFGRIIALMLWIYVSSMIILLGAYVSAAHDRYQKLSVFKY